MRLVEEVSWWSKGGRRDIMRSARVVGGLLVPVLLTACMMENTEQDKAVAGKIRGG